MQCQKCQLEIGGRKNYTINNAEMLKHLQATQPEITICFSCYCRAYEEMMQLKKGKEVVACKTDNDFRASKKVGES